MKAAQRYFVLAWRELIIILRLRKKILSRLCGTLQNQVIIINSVLADKSTLAGQDCTHVQDGSNGIPCKSHQSLKDSSQTQISKLKSELSKDSFSNSTLHESPELHSADRFLCYLTS